MEEADRLMTVCNSCRYCEGLCAVFPAMEMRRAFPDGRIGSDPSQATPEHGKRFYDTAVEEVARDYEKWVAR